MKTKVILLIICLIGCRQSFAQNKYITQSNDSVKIVISSDMDSSAFFNVVKQCQDSFKTTIKTIVLKFSSQKKLQAITGSVFTANNLESEFYTKKLKTVEIIMLKLKGEYMISSVVVLDRQN